CVRVQRGQLPGWCRAYRAHSCGSMDLGSVQADTDQGYRRSGMNWDLIPEVFFDLIARVLPGSLFLIGGLAVQLGPEELVRVSGQALPSANAASLLLFVLLAYFVGILLKGIWEFLAARVTPRVAADRTDDRPLSDDILTIREQIPSGASRLLKLQAEKNMCEVL